MKRTELKRTSELRRTAPLQSLSSPSRSFRLRGREAATRSTPTRRDTGFSARVKLQCRKRAGSGFAEEALCEACGVWLGRYGGEVQHRLARGSGGSSDPVVGSIANAVLLCGSGSLRTGCHGAAENREPHMAADAGGFWIRSGNGPEHDPRYVPILLHDAGGGTRVWLDDAGDYAFMAPAGEAA